MLKERENKTTGEPEWAFIYKANGLPASKVLRGATWQIVIDDDHPAEIQSLIEREVGRKVEAELEQLVAANVTDPVRIAQAVRRTVGKWVGETYRRQPMIVPTVIEV